MGPGQNYIQQYTMCSAVHRLLLCRVYRWLHLALLCGNPKHTPTSSPTSQKCQRRHRPKSRDVHLQENKKSRFDPTTHLAPTVRTWSRISWVLSSLITDSVVISLGPCYLRSRTFTRVVAQTGCTRMTPLPFPPQAARATDLILS